METDQTILQFTEAASGTDKPRLIAQNNESGKVVIKNIEDAPTEIQTAFETLKTYSDSLLNE